VRGELVYLGAGSNLGRRYLNIKDAAAKLSVVLSRFEMSRIYETPPMYEEKQPKFLNCVFRGLCEIEPLELLAVIHEIEIAAGRDREKSGWMGPRPIDIDILLFGKRIIDSKELTVPHPRMKERPFVLLPLVEMAPDLYDPVTFDKYVDLPCAAERKGIYYYTD